ncbi:amino acid permease [Streptomyces camponoticapitis]|uniref:Amino acid permease n=1 Tax=Streptomyces camponoticapitis TaxID=1616125 RepID=A0ABQ2E3I9_9ACTN|nr:amino acid permease [Streptomyces camponoticapitis]
MDVLRGVGREWQRVSAGCDVWRRALPVDPDLGSLPSPAQITPARFGRVVPVSPFGPTVLGTPPPRLPPAGAAEEEGPPSPVDRPRGIYRLRRLLLGPALASTAIARERMRKLVALPVLSADALSSVAYGPEAMLVVLVLAGSAGIGYTIPIAATIVFLMLAIGVSYRQTIRAYPHGGGSYIVASDNLGRVPGLVAAAGLMTDYILTVAVSIAAGVAAITSALPSLDSSSVLIGVAAIAVLLACNLRGIRQAGAIFAAPTYAFVIAMVALIAVGLADAGDRNFDPVPDAPAGATEGLGILLVMRAFASGATAMTGIEAISNAVPAFKPVEWRNARTTLTWMIGILVTLFAGIVALIHFDGILPRSGETALSQLAHSNYGSGPMYVYTQAATAAVLLLAANTAFNDFPRVLSLLARDDHAPRLFARMGDRLAFSNGIILLSVAAGLVYVAFDGRTASLIPLYAVGVFLAFSLSQAGMVVHWWRLRDRHWRKSLVFNATGGFLSAVVLVTAGITKFTEGAWVALVAVGAFLLVTTRIRRHYDTVAAALRLQRHAIELPRRTIAPRVAAPAEGVEGSPDGSGSPGTPEGREVRDPEAFHEPGEAEETEEVPEEIRHLSLVPIETLDRAGMRALAYAASLEQPVLVVHVSTGVREAETFREHWRLWGDHLPLQELVSPYRAVIAPLVNYIEALHHQRPDLTLTVILPEVVMRQRRYSALHGRTAPRLRRALRPLRKIVVTSVPFHV